MAKALFFACVLLATAACITDQALAEEQPVAGADLGQPRRMLLQDDKKAKQCLDAFNSRGGRTGIEAALGPVCKVGGPSFNVQACCRVVVKELNGGDLSGCGCNDAAYNQVCKQIVVPGLNCGNMRSLLKACGMKCN